MSEVIKAQAQKVLEARKVKAQALQKKQDACPWLPGYEEAVDQLLAAVNELSQEEALLSSIVIEEQLGVFSV